MNTTQQDGERPIHVWTNEVESSAMEQLHNMAKMPFLHPHGLAVMPDVHAGIGSTVGTVIATHKAIIPAAVGVDIGCGMNAVRLSLTANDLPESLTALRHDIERGVPLGAEGSISTTAPRCRRPSRIACCQSPTRTDCVQGTWSGNSARSAAATTSSRCA